MVAEGKERTYFFKKSIYHRIVPIFQFADGLFPCGNSSTDHTFRFIKYNCPNLKSFLDDVVGKTLDHHIPPIASIVKLTKKAHEDDRRKVTGDLYIKHLFYTAYLADEMIKEKKYYKPNKKKLLLATSFLHDTIELRRKRRETEDYSPKNFYYFLKSAELKGITPRDIKKIVAMVALMTPKDKPPNMPVDEWREIKREDFQRLMNITRNEVLEVVGTLGEFDGIHITEDEADDMVEIIKDVKTAEVIANLRETADDIIWKREVKDGVPNMKDFIYRFEMFNERVNYMMELPLDEKYKQQMQEDMEQLTEFVRS